MKIEETEQVTQGVGGGLVTLVRVRELAAGEKKPAGAREVPAETPVHGWKVKED